MAYRARAFLYATLRAMSNNLGKLTADERKSLAQYRADAGLSATTSLLLSESPVPVNSAPVVVLPEDQIPEDYDPSLFRFVPSLVDESPFQELTPAQQLAKVPPPATEIPGLTIEQWTMMLTAAVHVYQEGKDLTVSSILGANRRINRSLLTQVIKHKNFGKALELRGVTVNTMGLSERQMLVLSRITDFTDRRSIAKKLEEAGVKQWEWRAWQSNPTFKNAYRQLSEKLFDEAQAAVNVSLTQNAVNGDLNSQKYFNELSGRWNPAAQSTQDVRAVLSAVVDILNSTIKDPELLRTIASKLSTVMVAQGVGRK